MGEAANGSLNSRDVEAGDAAGKEEWPLLDEELTKSVGGVGREGPPSGRRRQRFTPPARSIPLGLRVHFRSGHTRLSFADR